MEYNGTNHHYARVHSDGLRHRTQSLTVNIRNLPEIFFFRNFLDTTRLIVTSLLQCCESLMRSSNGHQLEGHIYKKAIDP